MAARRAAASCRTPSAGAANPAAARTTAPAGGQLPADAQPRDRQQPRHRGEGQQPGDGRGGLLGEQPFGRAAEDGQVGAQGLAGQAEPGQQGRRRAPEPGRPAPGVQRDHGHGLLAGEERQRVGQAGPAGRQPGGDREQAEREPGPGQQRAGHGRAPFCPAAVPGRLTRMRGSLSSAEIFCSHQNPAAKQPPTTSSISCPAGVP